jgi:3-dehydroshikimate dehydratase
MLVPRKFTALPLLVALVVGGTHMQGQQPGERPPETLHVTSYADDGSPGTLRAAIAQSNASPGHYGIAIDPVGSAPYVITLRSPLPAIIGPVKIEGTAWKQSGDYIAIDGSGYITGTGAEACPGAVAGQYGTNVRTTANPGLTLVDTEGVFISGLEIRHFCIGILLNRTKWSWVDDNRIVANRGGAGVMLTGDDGQGNTTSATTIHNTVARNTFLDNGDGLELTRGAAFNLVAGNWFRSTAANAEPSQGIEILRGNDNVVVRNRFEGYSDGLQINWGDRNYIAANVFTDNTFGLSLTGIGNVVDGNIITGNAVGIAVRPAASSTMVRLTQNAISGNGAAIGRCEAGGSCDPTIRRGGIVFGLPGGEHAEYVGSRGGGVTPNPTTLLHICPHNAPDCQPAPNGGIRPPTLTGATRGGLGLTVRGRLQGEPRRQYRVEFFGNRRPKDREGEQFLDAAVVQTGPDGASAFAITIDAARLATRPASITATATSSDGGTSEFSAPIAAF